MTTVKRRKGILTYAVLATVAMLVLGPGWAAAAYDRDNSQQQYQNQQQYQDQDQGDQSYQAPPRAAQTQGRDMRLEQQIASRLRQQGYGAQGEIMILATGNRIILLGTVPDNRTKDGAEKAAKQIATRQSIDNRLHVNAQAKRIPDAQLAKDTNDKLGDELSQNVQVQARSGTVTLQGQLDNWRQVADAIDAAFAAGATQVTSQFSVAGATAMARGGAGANPPYGYAPGQQGQYGGQQGQYGAQQGQYGGQQSSQGSQGAMGGMTRASSSDLTLARQVASQLRQQLPPGQNVQPIQPQSIYVTAQRGTVTLHGYVQSNNQKQQAQQIVQSIQGVQNVRNDLTILSTRGGAGQAGGQGGFSSQGYGAQGSQGSQNYSAQGGQGYGGSRDQGLGGTGSQSGSYQPQGYISPAPGNQSQQDMSSQDQSGQSSGQQGFGATTDQSQFGRSSQSGSQQGSSSSADQSQFGQSSKSGSQQDFGSAADQDQSAQSSQFGGQQSAGGMAGQSQFGQSGQMGSSQAGRAMSPADMALAQKVAQQLKQKLPSIQNIQVMRPGTIYVMAAQGTVMLHGTVQNSSISQQATQIARAIPGVRDIQSTLRAGAATGGQAFGYVPSQQQGATGQGMTGQNQGTAGQSQDAQGSAQMRQIASQGQMGANQSSRQGGAANQGTYGQQGQGMAGRMGTGASSQSDQALAQQVAQKLRQQLTGIQNVQVARPGTIFVIVSNGTVTLDGLVSSNTQKQKAEQVAKSISGVQNVKNSLSISAGAGGQAYGYMPPGQDQGASAQSMKDQYGNQQFGNQGNQQSGDQSGGQVFLFIPPDEDQAETQSGNMSSGNQQFGNQMGDQSSDEDQAGGEQPDEGTY